MASFSSSFEVGMTDLAKIENYFEAFGVQVEDLFEGTVDVSSETKAQIVNLLVDLQAKGLLKKDFVEALEEIEYYD